MFDSNAFEVLAFDSGAFDLSVAGGSEAFDGDGFSSDAFDINAFWLSVGSGAGPTSVTGAGALLASQPILAGAGGIVQHITGTGALNAGEIRLRAYSLGYTFGDSLVHPNPLPSPVASARPNIRRLRGG